uniref:Uncharacterized protein n=1 Tax=Oryza meridionalis TaxID=40149 RepID=A0A0E0DN56_9ORYZ
MTHGGIPAHGFLSLSPLFFSPLSPDVVHCPSPELMRLLLCHVDRLSVVLVAAEFVFTEPHSKCLMLRLHLRGEFLHGSSGVTLEQGHAVEFTIHDRLYDVCAMARAWARLLLRVALTDEGGIGDDGFRSTPGKRKPISMPLASPVGFLEGSWRGDQGGADGVVARPNLVHGG